MPNWLFTPTITDSTSLVLDDRFYLVDGDWGTARYPTASPVSRADFFNPAVKDQVILYWAKEVETYSLSAEFRRTSANPGNQPLAYSQKLDYHTGYTFGRLQVSPESLGAGGSDYLRVIFDRDWGRVFIVFLLAVIFWGIILGLIWDYLDFRLGFHCRRAGHTH